jgi:hypothetical protein
VIGIDDLEVLDSRGEQRACFFEGNAVPPQADKLLRCVDTELAIATIPGAFAATPR